MLQKMQLDENQFEINSLISLISSGLNSVGSKEQLMIIILSPPTSYLLGTFISSPHPIFKC